ncbi:MULTISPECIES: metal-dependent transcriptional regulator [Corynebacterium]|uniref:metal-dependent transcriptional regulator n=1 Tax=Corynebacterium TaxID=1716 RepID=UPI0008A3D108|nr:MULTISPECIES: metal-dependent transcriptional regulator [Corynebacterium]MBU5653431.1 FeoA domain-containing protein [Corynebacterium aurimucosum]MDK6812892.1 iron dependent repressor, metal binding and dimerization domain protein [Corynebacterium sp. UMB6689]OFL24838.1 toxin repressor [Corynebacterium sp. HMSC062A03]OFP24982.1 toxin repressor [Corynebacterium sp. HMSC066C02]OFQ37072.1 toxin repressor [Corynebacterium sp. HMSC072D12]
MRDLVDTTEMYLRTIYELEEEGITPLRARIAERLEQSGPTVSQTVARMERDGLLHVRTDRSLDLTQQGRELATNVMRKHRLAERLLTDVLGLDIHKVHDEACRWEHVMSEEVEKRVVAVLEDSSRSPFGNPIPGLAQLGMSPVELDLGTRAIDLPTGQETEATIVQINEVLQADNSTFHDLYACGIQVGSHVTVVNESGTIRLTTKSGHTVELVDDLAHAIRVKED